WIPILKYDDNRDAFADRKQLDVVVEVIHSALKRGQKTLVHCGAGIERSPLAVVYYLCKKKGMTIEQAYKLVISKRSIVQDRRSWLKLTYDEYQAGLRNK
ncbi:MAG: dual specificity protein phosphatase family protein, partial [Thermodesulfobacteriota bacterium]